MSSIPTREQKTVAISAIRVEPTLNARRTADEKKIEELMESIRHKGLLEPVGVVNGGSEKQPYTLTYGFRRVEACKRLGVKEIPVVVSDDATAAVEDNLIENVLREDVTQADLAIRVKEMLDGNYATPKDVKPRSWTKDELMAKLRWTPSHLNNMLRVAENLLSDNPKVVKALKKMEENHPIPARALFAWTALKKPVYKTDEEGKVVKNDKGEKIVAGYEPDVDKQLSAIENFGTQREELVERERQRADRADKGQPRKAQKNKKGKGKGASAKSDYDRQFFDDPEERPAGRAYVTDFLDIMKGKVEETKGEDKHELNGAIKALRWLTGDLKNCPFVAKSEFDAYKNPPEEDEDEAAE